MKIFWVGFFVAFLWCAFLDANAQEKTPGQSLDAKLAAIEARLAALEKKPAPVPDPIPQPEPPKPPIDNTPVLFPVGTTIESVKFDSQAAIDRWNHSTGTRGNAPGGPAAPILGEVFGRKCAKLRLIPNFPLGELIPPAPRVRLAPVGVYAIEWDMHFGPEIFDNPASYTHFGGAKFFRAHCDGQHSNNWTLFWSIGSGKGFSLGAPGGETGVVPKRDTWYEMKWEVDYEKRELRTYVDGVLRCTIVKGMGSPATETTPAVPPWTLANAAGPLQHTSKARDFPPDRLDRVWKATWVATSKVSLKRVK